MHVDSTLTVTLTAHIDPAYALLLCLAQGLYSSAERNCEEQNQTSVEREHV